MSAAVGDDTLSRKNRKPTPSSMPGPMAKSWPRRHAFWLSLGLVVVATITAFIYFTRTSDNHSPTAVASGPQPITPTVQKAFTLDNLLTMKPEELKSVDIAEMNLLCATGLPGAEDLDIGHCLATLDQWAQRVKHETERHLYRVTDPRYADHYHHSEAYLRAEMLLQVLQVDLGVKYDMTAAHNFSFNDSRVAFIHGMIPAPGRTIADTPGGTCASMPVMYVAVGRRLGYPLKLVLTHGHVFARWDGQDHPNPAWRERFNIEGSGEGFSSFSDDYYKTWPFKITDADVKANGYLLSLTPMEEFAVFLASRGHCGRDNGQPLFAARCYENSCGYDPTRPAYRAWFLDMAAQSGYRPVIPTLARLLKERMRHGGARGPEQIIAEQQEAARREWLRSQGSVPPGVPPLYRPQLPQPYVPKTPSPYDPQGLRPPGVNESQHAVPQPYQPPAPYGPQPRGPGKAPDQP
jgi:hypothetical protein